MKKVFYLFTLLAVGICSLSLGYFYFWQEKIIFHPESTYHPPPVSYDIDQHFMRYGETDSLHIWHYKNNSFYPTVLYFSGNSHNISHRIFHIDLFKNIGVNGVMFDYRGYGSSTGSIRSKDSFYDSGALALRFVVNKLKIPEDQIIIWGHSLGAPISLKILGRKKVRGIILESPVTSIEEISKALYPFFPISSLLKYDFNSFENINNNNSPIILIHSKDDNTVPFSLAKTLYESIKRSNKRILIINGSHSEGSYKSFKNYSSGIRKFLSSIN